MFAWPRLLFYFILFCKNEQRKICNIICIQPTKPKIFIIKEKNLLTSYWFISQFSYFLLQLLLSTKSSNSLDFYLPSMSWSSHFYISVHWTLFDFRSKSVNLASWLLNLSCISLFYSKLLCSLSLEQKVFSRNDFLFSLLSKSGSSKFSSVKARSKYFKLSGL